MTVTLGGTSLTNIIDTLFTEVNKVSIQEFVNTTPTLGTDVWSKKPMRITYIMRVTHAMKWTLDQKIIAYASVTLNDTIYSINTTVWITRIAAVWEGHINWAFPWRYEVEVIKVT